MADHVDEARACLEHAAQSGSESASSAANAHATLALVEQQRIANLIAFVTSANASYSATGERPDAHGARRLRSAVDEIQTGLGLS